MGGGKHTEFSVVFVIGGLLHSKRLYLRVIGLGFVIVRSSGLEPDIQSFAHQQHEESTHTGLGSPGCINICKSYFGKIDEESIKNNFTMVYELIDGACL